MKDLANSISKGKNLEMVLPKYGQGMMSLYYKYAAVRLAMNYYTYSEMLSERLDEENKDFLGKSFVSFNEILNEMLQGNVVGEKLENAICKIDFIRNNIIKTMKGLTSLVDIFNILNKTNIYPRNIKLHFKAPYSSPIIANMLSV